MAFTPTNVSGQIVTWVPTTELRWVGKTMKKATLEQKWKNVSTGAEEWRDVVFVHSDEDH